MKYFFIGIVFCLCVFVGYIISRKYIKRKRFFESIIAFADKLSLDINFSRERLKVLIENFDLGSRKKLSGIDCAFLDFLDKKCDLSSEVVFKKADVLKEEEKDLILLFLKALGRSDVENQTKEISGFVTRFVEIKKNCDEEQKKYGTLSLKLGIVAGLFLAIVMI